MSTTLSAYILTAVGVTVFTIGSFVGLMYKSNENTTYTGATSNIHESKTDTGVTSLDQTTLNDDFKKHDVEAMVKHEVEKYCRKESDETKDVDVEAMVKHEVEKYCRKESDETKDLQTYPSNEGEVNEQVWTSKPIDTIIKDKVTQMFEELYKKKIQDKLDNLERKLELKKNKDLQEYGTVSEHSENDILDRLQKLEVYIQEKDSNPNAKYVESIYGFLSSTASKIKELYSQVFSSLPNITYVAVKDKPEKIVWAGQSEDVLTKGVLIILVAVELLCCLFCFLCCRKGRVEELPIHHKPPKPPKSPPPSLEIQLKTSYQKLENSLCVISFSEEYVNSYHLPLAKSLIEYMYQGKHGELSHIKKVTVTKPDNLNSVPRSKVFIVCVDYNERNDILEPDSRNKKDLLIRRATVRSLMDSLALVILVYCLEKSSEHLGVGDRYAYKLHSKIVAVEETKELDKKNCIFSVYKKFGTFQLGALKQTACEFLKKLEEIVS